MKLFVWESNILCYNQILVSIQLSRFVYISTTDIYEVLPNTLYEANWQS